jgi:hypothetical protein
MRQNLLVEHSLSAVVMLLLRWPKRTANSSEVGKNHRDFHYAGFALFIFACLQVIIAFGITSFQAGSQLGVLTTLR